MFTVAKENKNYHFRLSPVLKDEWEAMCEGKGISQQEAISRLIGWFVGQNGMIQSLILKQLDKEDVRELPGLLRNLTGFDRFDTDAEDSSSSGGGGPGDPPSLPGRRR